MKTGVKIKVRINTTKKREDNKVENDLRVMNMKKVGEKYRRTTRRGKKPGRRKKKNWQKLKEN